MKRQNMKRDIGIYEVLTEVKNIEMDMGNLLNFSQGMYYDFFSFFFYKISKWPIFRRPRRFLRNTSKSVRGMHIGMNVTY